MVIAVLRCVAFCVPVITPASIRSTKPSLKSSVWTPSSLWSAEQVKHLVGHRADPGLDRRPVRDPLGDERGDLAIGVGGLAGWHLHERVVGLAPAGHSD